MTEALGKGGGGGEQSSQPRLLDGVQVGTSTSLRCQAPPFLPTSAHLASSSSPSCLSPERTQGEGVHAMETWPCSLQSQRPLDARERLRLGCPGVRRRRRRCAIPNPSPDARCSRSQDRWRGSGQERVTALH